MSYVIKRQPARIAAFAALLTGLCITPLLHDPLLNDNSSAPTPDVAIEAIEPYFEIRWQRGRLHLAGHTYSERHETDLLSVAASTFPNAELTHAFAPHGIVPDHWGDTTLQIIYVLEETQSATAQLGPDTLQLRSVATDEIAWKNRLRALLNVLPATINVDNDTLLLTAVVEHEPVCERAFESFSAGPINFEESTATFRNSAYPRLDRIAGLAHFCSDATITVTGHTDASGSEPWNMRLSRQRSDAVRDYLIKHGVQADRLTAEGAGSAVPVASNATRYGRSKNRRIEIEWR
ncbi:MAG: OmpA family protein [Gammaproteobacteria bacterium]|nr:OmpA family protein [Gammaproteobacteria bacterium]